MVAYGLPEGLPRIAEQLRVGATRRCAKRLPAHGLHGHAELARGREGDKEVGDRVRCFHDYRIRFSEPRVVRRA